MAACLAAHRIAVCQSDAAEWPCWDAVTTDLVYVRLHGHAVTYASGYADAAQCAAAHRVAAAMIPIHRLLARIRWNPAFGRGRFELAYVDHRKKSLVRLPLARVWTSPEDHFAFVALEPDGSIHDVPYHRVRKVWRDGELIWSRDGSAQAVRR